jgi:hypothetical protein
MAVLPAGGWLAGRKLRQRSGVTGPPPRRTHSLRAPRSRDGGVDWARRAAAAARPTVSQLAAAVRARQYQDRFGEG